MIRNDQSLSEDANERIAALVRRLHETEQELRDLTGGEVDAVMHPTGHSYLLHQAQSRLLDAEAAQRQLAIRQAAILNALPAHIALLDRAGSIVSVNEAWRNFADDNALRHPQYCVGLNYVDVCRNSADLGSEDANIAANGIRSVLSGEARFFAFDYPCHTAIKLRWYRLQTSAFQEGASTGVVIAHIDISDRKLIEENARQHAARLAALVEAQQELAACADDASQLMERATNIAQRLTHADGADFEAIDGSALILRAASGIPFGQTGSVSQRNSSLSGFAITQNQTLRCDDIEADARVNPAAGRAVGVRSLIVAVLRNEGRPVGVIKALSRGPNSFGAEDADILELFAQSLGTILQRKQAEDELRIRLSQQAAIAELSHEALSDIGFADLLSLIARYLIQVFRVEFSLVAKVDPDRNSISFAAGIGWKPGTVVGVFFPIGRQTVAGYTLLSEGPVILSNAPEDPRFKDVEALRSHGIISGICVAIQGESGPWGSLAAFTTQRRLFTSDDITFVQSIANLISEAVRRQRAEEAMAQQAALLDKAHDAIVVWGLDDVVQFWNKGAERLYGWTREEAFGRFGHDLFDRDAGAYREAIEQVSRVGDWSGIVQQRHKDGRTLTVHARWTLIRDAKNEQKSIFSIGTDFTREVLLEQQLKQAQRLEAVGELTGGIAHDFNNLLTIIQGNSELLVEYLADNEQLRLMADMTLTAARRGATLIHRLLAFARRQPLEPKVINANDLLYSMESLLQRALRKDIGVKLMTGKDLWGALIDPSQLENAVLNLCINARDAMPGGGRITIETSNTHLDTDYVASHPGAAAGDWVMITVSDTGTGISPENLEHVFDPFFTSKDVGKGSGLGLSMVYGFIKQSRGHVKIYSEVGKGTAVKMFLPRSDSALFIADENATRA
ncbi:GAF domain-containing protein, partial [Bradyrhizobium sp.]|uniref:GAF domain-containing protein n=1 Tax=Bradyrhizobium sp. TaxID=376 RepID=UPI003C21546C